MKEKITCPRCHSENTHRAALNVAGNVAKEIVGITAELAVALPLGFLGNLLPGTAKYAAGARAQELGEKVHDGITSGREKKYICANCGYEWHTEE